MSSGDTARIGTWVPQVFFDLIARVVPGTIVIGALLIASYGPKKVGAQLERWLNEPPNDAPTLLLLVLTLAASYTLAIILWGGWCLSVGALRKVRAAVGIEAETGVHDPEGEFSVQYDFIKRNDPQAGNRITKLKAEIHLTAVLSTGLTASLLVNCSLLLREPDASRLVLGGILIVAILGSVSSWSFFVQRTRTAVENQCLLLCYREWRSGGTRSDAGDNRESRST